MAPKITQIFSKMDAKTRVFFLFAGVAVIGILIYILMRIFGGGPTTTGPSQVAGAPQGLQSVPGSQLTPEYYRALMQANAQAAQQAKISGGSAVPTLINVPGQAGSTNCNVVCPGDDTCDIASDLNDLVRQGTLLQEDANRLLDLGKNNVLPEEYSGALDDFVKQGKLTPEQARKSLECYKKQYNSSLIADSGKTLDNLIKSGKISLDTANEILGLQRKKLTPAEYAAELQRLVREGKLTPDVAAQLLAQYTQQHAAELAKQGALQLQQMAKAGQITPDVAKSLSDLQKSNVPVEQYAAELQRLVKAGKLTPEAAAKLLEQYKKQRAGIGAASGTLNNLVGNQEKAAASEVAYLVASGKIPKNVGDALLDMQKRNVTPEDYQAYLDKMVKDGKLTPQQAQQLLANYKKLHGLRTEAQKLAALQGNNASIGDYTNELKAAVAAGILTPEQAAQLLQEYQAALTPPLAPTPGVDASIPGSADFAKLQQRVAQDETSVQPLTPEASAQFAAAQADAAARNAQAMSQRIQDLQNAMNAQAQNLIAAWAPPVMVSVGGSPFPDSDKAKLAAGPPLSAGPPGPAGPGSITTTRQPVGPVLIKAGTILFAVLDTSLDSDYPDTPAMATIVSGELKGARLLGKMNIVQGKDKLAVVFNLMNKDEWPTGKPVNAFAMDPDTARTVMASSVDYHYLLRYGSMFASSFLSGYANAIMNSGSTNTTGIFGTSTTRGPFSAQEKIAMGLGQVGNAWAQQVQTYINTPPTIKVHAGVGLGILFMADVPE